MSETGKKTPEFDEDGVRIFTEEQIKAERSASV